MPNIEILKIHQFRNLTDVNIAPHSQFNFFFGQNGAGKTSLLESIYYLSMGRSFRTHLTKRLVQNNTDSFSIFACLNKRKQSIPMGAERNRYGERHLKINGEIVLNWSLAAKHLPLRTLSAMNYRFLLDGPKVRRQFLDWLVFHMKPSFFPIWKCIQRSLKQRNAALKANLPLEQIGHWDEILVADAEQIHKLRQDVICEFAPFLSQMLQEFLPAYPLKGYYFRGWSEKRSLKEQLLANLKQDLQRKYTHDGPQRADFQLTIHKFPAQDILSQGEQKLVTYALHFAQGLLLKEKTGVSPIYLIDDFSAELDTSKRDCVINLLSYLESQVFISGINSREITIPINSSIFHVKHGTVTVLAN